MTVSEHENEYILCVTASSFVLVGILIKFEYRFFSTQARGFKFEVLGLPFAQIVCLLDPGSLIRILLQNNHNEIWLAEISHSKRFCFSSIYRRPYSHQHKDSTDCIRWDNCLPLLQPPISFHHAVLSLVWRELIMFSLFYNRNLCFSKRSLLLRHHHHGWSYFYLRDYSFWGNETKLKAAFHPPLKRFSWCKNLIKVYSLCLDDEIIFMLRSSSSCPVAALIVSV